jgi:glutamate carboxypeptidase
MDGLNPTSERIPLPLNRLMDEAGREAPAVLQLLRDLVEIESPSDAPAWVATAQRRYAEALEAEGVNVRCEDPKGQIGDPPGVLIGDLGSPDSSRPLLVVGHLDTVHAIGTLAGPLPCRMEGPRLYGPGVYDMKAGLSVLVGALRVLRTLNLPLAGPLRILVTGDEEVGAPGSRAILEREGRGARGALVVEPSLPGGGLKIRRKGIGEYRLALNGIPAHAGIEPERGASAIHALGTLIPEILGLARAELGTTLNVGVIHGGTARNVVAERVEALLDLRVATAAEAERVDQALRALSPADPRVTLAVEGGLNRPPLEPSPESLRFAATAASLATALAHAPLEQGGSGGGSDGNLLSAVGCPVLDGLGVEGDGAHTHEEYVLVGDVPFRIALLAGLLAQL